MSESASLWGVPPGDYHENRYACLLDRWITSGVRWLDLGAGSRLHGAWIGPSPEELAGRASLLVGVDRHGPHMRANPQLTAAVLGDATALPFRRQSFDIVTANMVVEHLEDPLVVFEEVARLLVPGGLFIVSTPNLKNPIVRVSAWLLGARARKLASYVVEHRDLEHIFLTYYRCNSTKAFEGLARRSGMSIVESQTFSSYPFTKNYRGFVVLEGGLIRLLDLRPFRGARSNLAVVLRRCDD